MVSNTNKTRQKLEAGFLKDFVGLLCRGTQLLNMDIARNSTFTFEALFAWLGYNGNECAEITIYVDCCESQGQRYSNNC